MQAQNYMHQCNNVCGYAVEGNIVSILAKLCLHCDDAVLCVVCPSDEETAILHLPQSTILEYSEVLL